MKQTRLWYKSPAEDTPPIPSVRNMPAAIGGCAWETQGLPIGCGSVGAMVFGGIEKERFALNEKSLWTGGAYKKYFGGNRDEAALHIAEIRSLLNEKKKQEALELSDKFLTGVSDSFGAYQPFGDLFFECNNLNGNQSEYCRELTLDTAIAATNGCHNGISWVREAFCSYTENILAVRFTTSTPVNLKIYFASPHNITASAFDNKLQVSGEITDNGLKFSGVFSVNSCDGEVDINECINIIGMKNIVILFSASTNYKPCFPEYRSDISPLEAALNTVNSAEKFTYEILRQRHIDDVAALFNKTELNLKSNNKTDLLPTNERLLRYREKEDCGLENLLFNYGKYLFIASSRGNYLPANLQGIWNDSTDPVWFSDYHLNINLQMNYWLAGPTGLNECAEPLISYVESLVKPGHITAEKHFGVKRGWVANTMNNPFGFTAPGWQWTWGWAPNSNAFLCRNLWDFYSYKPDKKLLERIYPLLKGASEFWVEWLCEDTDGTLVSSPSYSPEHGSCEIGCAMDQQLCCDLFTNTAAAAEILKTDSEFAKNLLALRDRLSDPVRIGRFGQIMEWKEDLDDPDDNHRHLSHLTALYPCEQINEETPELLKAAEVTLIHRGNASTGWSRAWKLCLWARLHNAEQAYNIISGQLKECTHPNMLDTHPPFQIDGNFGFTAGVCELLLQSRSGCITLLPALPNKWASGSFKNLTARGGFELSTEWENHKIKYVCVYSRFGGKIRIKSRYLPNNLKIETNEETYTAQYNDGIILDTNVGQRFRLLSAERGN